MVMRMPSRDGGPNQLGASVVGWDPAVKEGWVVRLTGSHRVEVYRPRERIRMMLPLKLLRAPGVLKTPVRVEALYDRDAAERAMLTNLLQRQGYEDLDAVLAKGRQEGLEKSLQMGLEEGTERGVLRGKRDALKRVLRRRKLAMTEAIEATIDACSDERKLDRWLDRAVTASSAAEVVKPPKRVRPRRASRA
jgi:hypothetical protein